ncbi:hypothetical protein BX661DRAFT_182420, partial [Kickxella alabastrina]|uniref:uncharacterized protein n=1 Tax=Kickxella alabastrina TaxID=61397 RepID=UPI00221EC716
MDILPEAVKFAAAAALYDFRIGDPFNRLVDYLVALPAAWEPEHANKQPFEPLAPATTMAAAIKTQYTSGGIAASVQPRAYSCSGFLCLALFIGFIISRIHVLVHRQRVRPLGMWVRVAVYLPTHLLLLRTLSIVCVTLDRSDRSSHGATPWMQGPIEYVSRFAQEQGWAEQGDNAGDSAHALWLSFATTCLFDCVDVFVARLEGSLCAPYEYIGGLVEHTSLYYFYGGSLRIQELALLNVFEKLLVSHTLMMVTNGWQWRLLPTGAANLLMLHHFNMYPFVQVMSMSLLGISFLIVLTTVSIRWLAATIDRLGVIRRQRTRQSAAASGDNGEDEDETLYELTQGVCLPLYPDLRRDFSVEILDLAGTCLQQYSNQIRSSGFSRECGAMRIPRTTALTIAKKQAGAGTLQGQRDMCGMACLSTTSPMPSNSMDMVGHARDSIRKLSVAVWSLCVALGYCVLNRKAVSRGTTAANGRILALGNRGRENWRRYGYNDCDNGCAYGQLDLVNAKYEDSSGDDADFDFVAMSDSDSESESDFSESDFSESDDTRYIGSQGRFKETADLVCDILDNSDDIASPSSQLASAMAFIAHSIFDNISPGVLASKSGNST